MTVYQRIFFKEAFLPGILLLISIFVAHHSGHLLKKRESNEKKSQPEATCTSESDLVRIRNLHLTINPDRFGFLFSDKPLSLNSFQPATCRIDDDSHDQKVKVRIRGGHAWHWDARKPSLRIRVSGGKNLWNRDTLDLINPEDPTMLINPLADHLAIKLGLAASLTRFCRVWVNDRYFGIYNLTDRLDETFLPRIGMAALPVVEGNALTSEMWIKPDLWDYRTSAPERKESAKKALEILLKTLEPPVVLDRILNLDKLISFETLANWSALVSAIASLHSDDFRNQHLIYSESSNMFFPAVNDLSGFGALTCIGMECASADIEIPIYEYLTPILNAAFRFPHFQFNRNKILWNLIHGMCSVENIKRLSNAIFYAIRQDALQETNRGALVIPPLFDFPIRLPISFAAQASSVIALQDFVEKRNTYIKKNLASSEVCLYPFYTMTEKSCTDFDLFVIEVSGHSPVEWNLGTWSSRIKLDTARTKIIAADSPFSSPTLRLYPGLQQSSGAGIPYINYEIRLSKFILTPASQTYLIGIKRQDVGTVLDILCHNGINSVSRASTTIEISRNPFLFERLYNLFTVFHPWNILEKLP